MLGEDEVFVLVRREDFLLLDSLMVLLVSAFVVEGEGALGAGSRKAAVRCDLLAFTDEGDATWR